MFPAGARAAPGGGGRVREMRPIVERRVGGRRVGAGLALGRGCAAATTRQPAGRRQAASHSQNRLVQYP